LLRMARAKQSNWRCTQLKIEPPNNKNKKKKK
jgi:hypothetical protein